MILSQSAREVRDDEVDALKQNYEKKIRKIENRLRSAEAALEKKKASADLRKKETYISIGESLLGV